MMKPLDIELVKSYVNDNIVAFHANRIQSLEQLTLAKLLKKNPYLFKAKNISTAGDLITDLLTAFLSSSEEKMFGDFLERLALFVAQETCGGHKSSAPGIDLEFINDGVHFIVSIKSGPNWGNSAQTKDLGKNLITAVTRLKQLHRGANIQPVLGICYGKTRTRYVNGYMKVVGQNFWYLISENKELYTDIIEPIGYRAKEHNDSFHTEKSRVINRFTGQFIERFCDPTGAINWQELVVFNSGNYDMDHFLPEKGG